MKNLGLSLLALLLALLVGLLGTKIILSVSLLFGLTFLSGLGYLKIYGLVSIINMINYRRKVDSIEGEDTEQTIKNIFSAIYDKVVHLLVFWGMSYFMYYLITNFIG